MAYTKRAYSYIRFSREHQSQGDSLRRQLESTRRYCDRKGLVLDESLALRDLGVSAFKGDNVESGDLGRFLQAVSSGHIPAGSALVVEGLDRLSRQDPWKTISLLKQLKDSGIEIHLTMADIVLSPDEPDDGMKLMYSVITAIRAHDESKTKSKRLIDAFAAKRARAAKGDALVSKSLPWWLEIKGDKIIAPPNRAKVVKRAFEMTAKGFSSSDISRRFNDEGFPTWRPKAKQWSASRIRDLIRGDAALGTLSQTSKTTKAGRSHPEIKGYYPVIVTEDLVAEARAAMKANAIGFVGRKATGEKPINIFRGLLRHKGRWMRFQPHPNGKFDPKTGKKGYNGYYDVINPDTTEKIFWGISAKQLEPVILQGLRELRSEDLLPPKLTKGPLRSALIRKEVQDLDRRRVNLLLAVEEGSTSIARRLLEVENTLVAKRQELTEAETREASALIPRTKDLKQIEHGLDNNDSRKRTAAAIRRIVAKIDIASERDGLPWDEAFEKKVRGKFFAETEGTLPESHEPSNFFADPVKKDKRRKTLWVLVTFISGVRRLIARTSLNDERIVNVRLEASPYEHENNQSRIIA